MKVTRDEFGAGISSGVGIARSVRERAESAASTLQRLTATAVVVESRRRATFTTA
jgi:hypothetical protein